MKEGYLPKDQRKKILLLSDDMRLHSGIATMARELVIQTAHHFNWVNLGGAMNHPDEKKAFDLSADVNKQVGIEDSYVRLYATSGYGTAEIFENLFEQRSQMLSCTSPILDTGPGCTISKERSDSKCL